MSFDNILINYQPVSDGKPSGMENCTSTRKLILAWHSLAVWGVLCNELMGLLQMLPTDPLGQFSSAATKKACNHSPEDNALKMLIFQQEEERPAVKFERCLICALSLVAVNEVLTQIVFANT